MIIRRQLLARAIVLSLIASVWTGSAPMRTFAAAGKVRAQAQTAPPSVLGSTQPDQSQARREPFIGRVQPVTDSRVGVDSNQIVYLSLHDAILKALENNNEIQVQRTNVRISEYALKALQGYYDTLFGSDLNFESNTSPTGSRLSASGSGNLAAERDTYAMNYNFAQQIPIGGGNVRLSFNNARTSTNITSTALRPQYFSTIQLDYRQPLFRNFRNDQTRSQIKVAKKAMDLTDSQFRQRVTEIIAQVQKSYWDLVFAIRNVEITKESMDLARINLDNSRKQVEAGTLARIELAQSEAELERRHQDVISSIGGVTVAENILKSLILGDPNSSDWHGNFAPTESIEFLAPAIDYESAQRLAMANRPELSQLRLQGEQNKLDQKYYHNQALPQIDIVGRYGSTGLAGNALPPSEPPPGLPPEFSGFFTSGPVPDIFVGGLGRAFNTALQNKFRDVIFGVSISFPFRNRTAEAYLGRSKAQSRVLQFQEKQLQQVIQSEVRNGLQNVETARQTIEAARAARVARETQLAGEQKKFGAGLSTTFFVLNFQNQLSLAKGAELQALVNYNKSIAELQRVLSTTLDANNVQVTSAQSKN